MQGKEYKIRSTDGVRNTGKGAQAGQGIEDT